MGKILQHQGDYFTELKVPDDPEAFLRFAEIYQSLEYRGPSVKEVKPRKIIWEETKSRIYRKLGIVKPCPHEIGMFYDPCILGEGHKCPHV